MNDNGVIYLGVSDISGKTPGLYNGSFFIRNNALSKNRGKYSMFSESLSSNGGEAVGEAYEVGDALRSKDLGDGGLFSYTHEAELDTNLSRNTNLLSSFLDYEESRDIERALNEPNNSLPWNNKLMPYSDASSYEKSSKFADYREYAKSIFQFGLSFESNLKGSVNSLMYGGFTPSKTLLNDVTEFIDGHQGTILNPVPTDWALGDTNLGYTGKRMVQLQRFFQKSSLSDPITRGLEKKDYEETEKTIFRKGNIGKDFTQKEAYTDNTQSAENYITEVEKEEDRKTSETTKNIRQYNFSGNNFKPTNKYVSFVGEEDFGKTVGNTDVVPGKNRKVASPDEFNIGNGGITTGLKAAGNYHGEVGYNFYDEGDLEDGGRRNKSVFTGQTYDSRIASGVQENTSSGNKKNLLNITRKLFNEHKIDTLMGRFHTSVSDNPDSAEIQETQSAVSSYGLSHGRNLLAGRETINDYDNPYCRVWTYHHQYSKISDLIRPFDADKPIEEVQANYLGRPILGLKNNSVGSWSTKTVLNKNGLVNIAPMRGENMKTASVDIKQCMFSIENLAWKDMGKKERNFPESERGPLGGRIMWFPPYDLNITENSNPEWNKNTFIGRGESIYTYSNTERTGTLSFTIVADHPSVVDYWMKNHAGGDGFIDKDEAEQQLLRFYAGCDNLDLTEVLEEIETPEEETHIDEEPKKKDTVDGRLTVKTGYTPDNGYSFYLYFPNNLSGKDYLDEPDLVIDYLMLGKQKEENIETGVTVDNVKWAVYDRNIERTPRYTSFSGEPWGYETGKGAGESVSDANLGITDSSNNNHFVFEKIYPSLTENSKQPKGIAPNESKFVWGYAHDNDTSAQRLQAGTDKLVKNQYLDITDLGFNASRTSKSDADINCSFLDAYIALQLQNSPEYSFIQTFNERIAAANPKYDVSEVAEFQRKMREMLYDPQKLENQGNTNMKNAVRKVYYSIKGGASDHGYSSNNNNLAANRRRLLEEWIKKFGGKDWEYVENEASKIPEIGGTNGKDVSDALPKEARRAKIQIWWEWEHIDDVNPEPLNKKKNSNSSQAQNKYRLVKYKEGNDFSKYGKEYTFFKELKSSDNFLYRNIIDKVKYFDPAYHAITPEGFNGRLAFLHQCTRQGPTVESNSNGNNAGYAGNLSFGRPPVCILRLGDFYNTRIVINSLQINFDTNQWDLNQEGIGVQPMLAKVTMSFVFQGGSSLGGPVTRLQNAISFNYYANQEVYDDRADSMVYKDGKVDDEGTYIWDPWTEVEEKRTTGDTREIDTKKTTYLKEKELETKQAKVRSERVNNTVNSVAKETLGKIAVETLASECLSYEQLIASLPGRNIEKNLKVGDIFTFYKKKYGKSLLVDYTERNCQSLEKWVENAYNENDPCLISDFANDAFRNYILNTYSKKNCENFEEICERFSIETGRSVFYNTNDQEIVSIVNTLASQYSTGFTEGMEWVYANAIYQILFVDNNRTEIGNLGYRTTEDGGWEVNPSSPTEAVLTSNDAAIRNVLKNTFNRIF